MARAGAVVLTFAIMLTDPELSALLEQAARNLDSLELLARSARETDMAMIQSLRERLEQLKRAYTIETDALTRQVLKRAIERRTTADRRRPANTLHEALP